jgi:hypothetical protein
MPQSPEAHRAYMRAYRARKKAETAAEKRSAAGSVDTKAKRPPRKKAGPHRAAVTRMLTATGLVHVAEEAPLVELVKSLAAELDEGAEGAVASRYRAALADVRKVLAYSGRPKSSADPTPPAEEAQPDPTSGAEPTARVNSLAAFKQAHGIG